MNPIKHVAIIMDGNGRWGIKNKGTRNSGHRAGLKTLEKILQEYNFEPTILKLDCEGCEYDVILESDKSILQNFSHIQIEYHYGYENLKNKLISCGFNVKVTKPNFIRNRQAGKNMFYGYLYATRSS